MADGNYFHKSRGGLFVTYSDLETGSCPIRVLHVVGEMNRGGIESWLMQVMRNADLQRFRMDFVVETPKKAIFDDEIRELGGQIFNCGSRKSLKFAKRFRSVLCSSIPYDVVHSHVHYHNGMVMRIAHSADVPVRISHSHTDTTAKELAAGWFRGRYIRFMRHWIARHSTVGLGASIPAAVSLFGADWRESPKWNVFHCGIDLTPFTVTYDRESKRRELGIPMDAWVVGHVGRMVDVKNHTLAISTFAEACQSVPDAHLLLVGEGPLESAIKAQVQDLGIIDRVHFTSNRSDVPEILCSVMDVFIFPSKFEGLGLALIEAQAAGLPCIVSDVVPKEADVIPALITRLRPDESWTSSLLAIRNFEREQRSALEELMQTDFNIQSGVCTLQRIYSPC